MENKNIDNPKEMKAKIQGLIKEVESWKPQFDKLMKIAHENYKESQKLDDKNMYEDLVESWSILCDKERALKHTHEICKHLIANSEKEESMTR